jgi:hypothetical protein
MDSFAQVIKILKPPTTSTDEEPCYVRVGWNHQGNPYCYCLLCGQYFAVRDKRSQHMESYGHGKQVEQFNASLHRAVSVLQRIDDSQQRAVLDRMEKLGSPAWRNAVAAALLIHITSNRQEALLAKAMSLLVKYERLEQLALLELAIWKAECLNRMPDIKNDYSKAVSWIKSGWKTLKEELRGSSAIAIIISLVRPYTATLA